MKWHYFHIRKRTPFYVHFWTYGVIYPTLKVLDLPIGYVGHAEHKVIMDYTSFHKQTINILKHLKKKPLYVYNLLMQHNKFVPNLFKVWKHIYKVTDLKNQSNLKLISLLDKFFKVMRVYDAYIFVPLFIEKEMTNQLKDELNKRFPEKLAEKYYNVIVMPVKLATITQEKISLLKIAKKIKENKKDKIKKDISKHIENFSWMSNQLYTMDFHDKNFYIKQAKNIVNPDSELKKIIKEREKIRKEYYKTLNSFKKNKKIIALFKTIQESVFFRNFRTEKLYQSGFYLRPLLNEIAKRLGLNEKEVVYLTTFEMRGYLKKNKKVNKKIIKERKKGFIILPKYNQGNVISGKKLSKVRTWIDFKTDKNNLNITQLKGQSTYKGIVKGSVRVVMDVKDLKKLKLGSILVTTSTTPSYVHYLHKVTAIITDEGGILSHAAIISRELNIPCIIGTKIATKIFKDGDLVEVDANKGIIKKIK